MIYHFNDFTVVQLIHLMKGCHIFFREINHDTVLSRVMMEFDNRENLNQGRYNLDVLKVKAFEIVNPQNLESDILHQIKIEKDPNQITFENKNSVITINIHDFELRAISQTT